MYYPALTWRPISSCLMQASTRGIVSSKRIISSATDLFRCRRATTAAAAMSLTKTRKVHTARREQSTLLHFWSIAYGLGQPDRGSRVSVKLWTEAGHRGPVLRSVTSPSGPAEDLVEFQSPSAAHGLRRDAGPSHLDACGGSCSHSGGQARSSTQH